MKVPFVDLRAQHDEIRAEVDRVIGDIIDRSSFIGGDTVTAFEQNFARYCGARHAVACGSGTDAIRLGLIAAGIKAGEEVITVPHTFIATVEAISLVGAHPVFVDIDGPTYNISPDRLEAFLKEQCRVTTSGDVMDKKTGRRVTAVLPVHLYGLPADMKPIAEIARQYRLKIIEDACQAHGAKYALDGVEKTMGGLGSVTAFSFYPGKNLGAMGEGGAVTTDDDAMASRMRALRDHSQTERYIHSTPLGWNSRLDAMQCAILNVKLNKLDEWNQKRRRAAEWYQARLKGDARVILPVEPAGRQHVYHLFVVRLPDREKVRHAMTGQGIGVGLHYPIPLHLQAAYRDWGWRRGDFPESEAAASSILSLPIFPHITEEQVEYVCRSLNDGI